MQDEHDVSNNILMLLRTSTKIMIAIVFTQNAMFMSFFYGSKCYLRQRRISRESSHSGTASTPFAFMSKMSSMYPSSGTIFHVMSHQKRAQIGHIISVFLIFLACRLLPPFHNKTMVSILVRD